MIAAADKLTVLRNALRRQAAHWAEAADQLQDRDRLMHAYGRTGIHRALFVQLEQFLDRNCGMVLSTARKLLARLNAEPDEPQLLALQREVIALRELYLATETSVHFYTDAVNTRTSPHIASILRACDILCKRSLDEALAPLRRTVPHVLTYVDKGIGASILRSDLRLWNGSTSPFAAVKVTYHNLFRPTAIVHETGHQLAHMIGWNEELSRALASTPGMPDTVCRTYAEWASEIAADLFAFLHTGYGSVAALHDVVSGNPQQVFAHRAGDPHPTGYVRVLLAIAFCRFCYGKGPWDEMQHAFLQQYDIRVMQAPGLALTKACAEHAEHMAKRCLSTAFQCFGGRTAVQLVDPQRVSPAALNELERTAGPALHTSPVWLHREPLRTLALNSLRIATEAEPTPHYRRQEKWMSTLGISVELN
jgi:hypothetical protein